MYVVEQMLPASAALLLAAFAAAQITRADAFLFVLSAVIGAVSIFAYDRWRRWRRKAR